MAAYFDLELPGGNGASKQEITPEIAAGMRSGMGAAAAADLTSEAGLRAAGDAANAKQTDDAVVYVSKFLPLDSNISTGGGTDVTTALNTLLTRSLTRPTRFIFDGCALTSGTLVVGGDATLEFRGANSGVFKAANSAGHILTNRLNGITRQDRRVEIIGGVFNGNEANQSSRYENNTPGGGFWKIGLWFGGLQELVLTGVSIRNSKTFALTLGGTGKVRASNLRISWDGKYPPDPAQPIEDYNNWDGVHFWGDNDDTEIDGLVIDGSDDDAIAMNTDENWQIADIRRTDPAAPGTTNPGNCGRIVFRNVTLTDCSNPVRFINTGNPGGYSIGDVIFEHVKGNIRMDDWSNAGPNTGLTTGAAVTPVNSLTINDWNLTGWGNIQAGSIAHPLSFCRMDRIAPQCTVRVLANSYAGDYYTKPVTAAPTTAFRKALTVPYTQGQRVFDLLTGNNYQAIDRAASATDAGWAQIGSTAARAPTHAWLFNTANGSCPDIIGSAHMVSSSGTTLAAGSFGNGVVMPVNEYARATLDMTAYSDFTICGWLQWSVVDTGAVQTFIEYAAGTTPIWVMFGRGITRSQLFDLEPVSIFVTTNQTIQRAAYASNLNGVQRYRPVFIALRVQSSVATMWCDRDKFSGPANPSNWQSPPGGSLTLSVNKGPRAGFSGGSRWDGLALWNTALSDDVVTALSRLAAPCPAG